MSAEVSRSEEDLCFLWSVSSSLGGRVIVTSLLNSSSKINSFGQNPGVRRSGIEKSPHKLWWVTYVHIRDVGIILEVVLNNMGFHFFSRFVNWAVSDIIDASVSIGLTSALSTGWRW